jgi:ADP-heptose:LPS heptosyltransferase
MKNIRILVVLWGGIGDIICVTPTFKALRNKYPFGEITVIHSIPALEIIKHNPNIDKCILHGTKAARNEFRNIDSFHIKLYTQIQNKGMLNIQRKQLIANEIGLDVMDINNEIYLTTDEKKWAQQFISEYNNVIILQSSSKRLGGKQWRVHKWEELVSKFKNYTFLLVGTDEDNFIKGSIDLRGKTTIRQAIALLNVAKLFVGIDSFLNHATNATCTKGVILFGSSNPMMWGYNNNINIYKKISCSPCFTYESENCPDNICISSISVQEVEMAIIRQLDR